MNLTISAVSIFAILALVGCAGPIIHEKANTIDVAQRQCRNEIVYRDNDNTPYTGEVTSFYPNGQKASEEHYVEGKKSGKSLGWHENGQQKLEVYYVEGKEQGKAITWDESGERVLEIEYVDGVILQQSDP